MQQGSNAAARPPVTCGPNLEGADLVYAWRLLRQGTRHARTCLLGHHGHQGREGLVGL